MESLIFTFESDIKHNTETDKYSPSVICKHGNALLWERVVQIAFYYPDEARSYADELCQKIASLAVQSVSDIVSKVE